MSSRQLNSKNNGPGLSFKNFFKHWILFPVVCCDGWQRWTWIETLFQVLMLYLQKSPSKQLLWFIVLLSEFFLLILQGREHFVYVKRQAMTSAQIWPKTVISFACVADARNLLYRLHYTGASNDSMFGEAKLAYNLLYLEEG